MVKSLPDAESDAALVARFARLRDQRAFAELIDRHGPMVFGVCSRMLGQRQDAEDAMQAVFLTLSVKAKALSRVGCVAGWLHNVAVRVSLNLLKMNRRREQGLRSYQNARVKTQPDESHDLKEVLDEELARLPARLKEAVILRDLESRSRSEAAKRMGASLSTVDNRLSRGRKLLRERLIRRGVSFGSAGMAAALAQCAEASPALGVELARQTVRNAQLFLAGKSAEGMSAATRITSLAQGVLNTMFLTKLSTTVCMVALAAALVLTGARSVARAQNKGFFDDFEDMNATDDSPVTWAIGPQWPWSTFSVANGDLRVSVSTPDRPGVIHVPAVTLDNTSIRAQVRLEGRSTEAVAVFARGNPSTGKSYALEIAADGFLWLGVNGVYQNISTALRPTDEDVVIQLDAIDDTINAWAWRASESMPLLPQISLSDDQLSAGVPGVYYASALQPQGTSGTAVYRYVHVATSPIIPEPSTAALGSLGFVALGGFVFRVRLNRVRSPR